jgi:hypothetical protein
VTDFENNWQKSLELALRRVAPVRLEECGLDAIEALRAVRGRTLLALDETLRRAPPYGEQDAPEEAVADAYLFVAACNGDGFMRQKALIAFRRFPSRLAFAAGLIRSTDWVAAVRDAGISLVNVVLPRLAPSDVVHSLELVVRLTDRVRAPHDGWRAAVMPVLMAPAGREALWAAVRDPVSSSELRRAAFEFLELSETPNLAEVLSEAVADPDPCIGLWALRQSEGRLTRGQHVDVLKIALAADHAAVRLTALRMHVAAGVDDCAQTLRAALFDVSRGVRGFAAFELKHAAGEDPLPGWRLAIDGADRRRSEVAMAALCEFGDSSDVERLAADLGRRNATIRAAVLAGLWRTGSAKLEAVLSEAVFDRSKLVLRQVNETFRRSNVSLDASTIDAALARADDKLTANLFAFAQRLGKWEELEFLLRHAVRDDADRAGRAADCIDHWVRTEWRRFTAPSGEQVRRIASLSAAAQSRHSGRRWRVIDHNLSAFRNT